MRFLDKKSANFVASNLFADPNQGYLEIDLDQPINSEGPLSLVKIVYSLSLENLDGTSA